MIDVATLKRKLDKYIRIGWAVPKFYVMTFPLFSAANLTAGASVTNNDVVPSDAFFEVQAIDYAATIANAAYLFNTRPLPNVTALITDSGSSENWMDNPVPLVALCGYGELPGILPETRILVPNSNVKLQLSNFDAATAYNIYLSLVGRKLTWYGPDNPTQDQEDAAEQAA